MTQASRPSQGLRYVVRAGMLMTLLGFFLPWARLEMREPSFFKRISEGMRRSLSASAGHASRSSYQQIGWSPFSLPDVPTEISGAQIPMLAHKQQAKVSMQLIELFTGKSEGIAWKSFAVLLVPTLALCGGWLLSSGRGGRLVAVLVGLLCATIDGVGFLKVLTINTKVVFSIGIRPGLWLTLWGYAILACAGLGRFVPSGRRPWLATSKERT